MKKLLIIGLIALVGMVAYGQALKTVINPHTGEPQVINTDAGGSYTFSGNRDSIVTTTDSIKEWTDGYGVWIDGLRIINGIITSGVYQGTAITDMYVSNGITLDDITQITNRDHGSLTGIGELTHDQLDDTLNLHGDTLRIHQARLLALEAGGGDMIAANNLSDIVNIATGRVNLDVYSRAEVRQIVSDSLQEWANSGEPGLGRGDTLGVVNSYRSGWFLDSALNTKATVAQLNTKSSARLTLNAQTGTSYTLQLTDTPSTSEVLVTLTNALPIALSVPTNASVAFEAGSRIHLANGGAGTVTIGGAGISWFAGISTLDLTTGEWATLVYIGSDLWGLVGGLE